MTATKDYQEVSEAARNEMLWLGDYAPTFRGDEIKGVRCAEGETHKSYLGSGDLRRLAAACLEVAAFLDREGECV